MRYRKLSQSEGLQVIPDRFRSRASTATYFDADRLLRVAAVNEPRYVFDPVSRVPLRLLLENASANQLLHSGDMSNAVWTPRANWDVEGNVTAAPDGTLTGARLFDTGVSTSGYVRQARAREDNSIGCFSVFVKKDLLPTVQVRMYAKTSSMAAVTNLNFDTGVASSSVSNGAQLYSTGVEFVGNGWWRVWVSINAETGADEATTEVALPYAATGDGTKSVFVWGGQFEDGPEPTSYIPTTSAVVVRAADIFTPSYEITDVEGDYQFVGNSPFLVNTPAAVAQAIRTRLRLTAGEWFLDSRVGFDLARVLGTNTGDTRDLEVKRVILGTEGVLALVDYFSQVDTARRFTVQATVDTIYGPTTITESF